MKRLVAAFACSLAIVSSVSAAAAPAEPRGAHPRILLSGVKASWQKLAAGKGPVADAIGQCEAQRGGGGEYARDHYMGLDWARFLQNCLVAWGATGKEEHAKTAMIFFLALIDDLEVIGDGKGGDNAARRDSGFAMRALGPYTAIAYDWLHDHPLMTDTVKARARQRFKAWTDWYLREGYRARSPGTNYQAGYLVAATLLAIAQGGEAGGDGARLWNHVVDDLWLDDMAKGFAPGGVLDGGDWAEGWQYGALSVAEYALAARAITEAGVTVPGYREWLRGLYVRFVHGLAPDQRMFVGGDTGNDEPNLDLNVLPLAAVVLGGADRDVVQLALGELERLAAAPKEFPLYGALAAATQDTAAARPADWPTWYLARGVGALYARSAWSKDAIWAVTQCTKTLDVDHIHPNAGNFVLNRGGDEVIVDPSPYGSMSSLTSNAPTVESAQLPDNYKPSQAYWSKKTGFVWAEQHASGLIAARCDYADQYRFQERPSDVPAARRDLVIWPVDGDAIAVVIDRAASGDARRGLHLRFRTLAPLTGSGDLATGKIGGTQVAIRRLASSSGTPALRHLGKSDCFKGATRGGCDVPRFPISELGLVVAGPTMEAWHLIEATGAAVATAEARRIEGAGFQGVVATRRGKSLAVVAGREQAMKLSLPPETQLVVLDPPAHGGQAKVSATTGGQGCEVTIGEGTDMPARPLMALLDKDCKVSAIPSLVAAIPQAQLPEGHSRSDTSEGSSGVRSPRSGCCGAQATSGADLGGGLLALASLVVLRRRRRA